MVGAGRRGRRRPARAADRCALPRRGARCGRCRWWRSLLGGPVALRERGLGAGVPDLQTLADVMQGSATGWVELLTTLPFVDVAGPPALVPYLLGFVGAAHGRRLGRAHPQLPGSRCSRCSAVLVAVLLLRRPEGGVPGLVPGGVRRARGRLGGGPRAGVRARRRSGPGSRAGTAQPRPGGGAGGRHGLAGRRPADLERLLVRRGLAARHGARRARRRARSTHRCAASGPSPSRNRDRRGTSTADGCSPSPVRRPAAGSGCSPLDRYDGREWRRGQRHHAGHDRRRVPADGHHRSTTRRVVPPCGSGSTSPGRTEAPGCRRWGR